MANPITPHVSLAQKTKGLLRPHVERMLRRFPVSRLAFAERDAFAARLRALEVVEAGISRPNAAAQGEALHQTRNFRTAFPHDFLHAYQRGTLGYTYKGIPCLKSPIDLAIYTKLVWDLRPGSLIEIGSNRGGSALWFADQLAAVGLNCRIVSIDLQPPTNIADPRIEFRAGDAAQLGECLSQDRLTRLAHPWLIIEDSAHLYPVTKAAIRFFADAMRTGDVLVVEDGVIDDLGLTDEYDGGPNRAVAEFIAEFPGMYRVMEEYCDMFGTNATYNPNGYLVRL